MPELREKILNFAGPEAAARLSVTCQATIALIQIDNRLWNNFAASSFGKEARLKDMAEGPMTNPRSHADHSCNCFYFRYWATWHTCRHCDVFSNSTTEMVRDGDGVVCNRCYDCIQRKSMFFDL